MTTVERKYALTKVGASDYLLPSNDAQTVYRITRYADGPSQGLDIPRDREFWGIWKWHLPLGEGPYVDTEDWNRWEMQSGGYDTRREAINAVLEVSC